jgi:hypothetical protein
MPIRTCSDLLRATSHREYSTELQREYDAYKAVVMSGQVRAFCLYQLCVARSAASTSDAAQRPPIHG